MSVLSVSLVGILVTVITSIWDTVQEGCNSTIYFACLHVCSVTPTLRAGPRLPFLPPAPRHCWHPRMLLQHFANNTGGTIGVERQMLHLKVSQRSYFKPKGIVMLVVSLNILETSSFTCLISFDRIINLAALAVRLRV